VGTALKMYFKFQFFLNSPLIAEEVIIGTKSNAYLKEHQAKYPAYHFTIGGKGDPLPESDDPVESSKIIQAPVKKHSPEEEKYLKENPKNHKYFEDEDHDKEWSREGDSFSNLFLYLQLWQKS
jgi:hypothetical protein